MNRAETAIAYDDDKTFRRSMLTTAALGTLFLLGVVGLEWNGELRPWDDVYGAVFFVMTGAHALHVLSGVILILIVWNLGRKGHYTSERHWAVEATASYWHYVDLVWVFFYPALYLMGTAV
jgi:cytochrome c oxidase subunit 3